MPYIIDKHDLTSIVAAYIHMLVTNLLIYNLTKCVYHFVIDSSNEKYVVIVQFFIVDVLVIYMNLKSHVSHMLYGCNFSHCTDVPIIFLKDKYHLCENGDNKLFDWVLRKKHGIPFHNNSFIKG